MKDTDVPRPRSREELWDLFIDELDRSGQAGSAADVIIPATLHPEAPSGKRFGELDLRAAMWAIDHRLVDRLVVRSDGP